MFVPPVCAFAWEQDPRTEVVGGTVLPTGWVLFVIGEIVTALIAWRIYVLWKRSQPPPDDR